MIKELMETILELKGITKSDLASRIDVSRATLSGRLKRDNLSIDTLNQMLKALDYKIVIAPRNKRLAENEFDLMTKIEKPAKTDDRESQTYDLWLKKDEFTVEQYGAELNKIWSDDAKKINKEFERYMKWYMEEKLNS